MKNYQDEAILTTPYFEEGEGQLQYKLINTPGSHDPSSVYSLAIIKLLNNGGVETSFTYDIARERSRALRLAELLCRNSVTPCCASEIIDDLLNSME